MTAESADALRREAVRRIVRLTSGEATAEDAAEAGAWRRRSPAHAEAWRTAARAWTLARPAAAATASHPVARRRLIGGLALATCIGGIAVLGRRSGLLPGMGELLADHRTGTAERRTVTLADGTVVEMNARTAFDARLAPDRRQARLVEGEAVFTIAVDRPLPFAIAAGGGRSVAGGGTVAVRHRDGRTEVACLAGRVEVECGRPVALAPGDRVAYAAAGPEPVERFDPAVVGAWRRGLLVARDQPLAEVVAELNRHRRGYVRVGSEEAGRRRITGIFHLSRPDEILDHLIRALDLPARRLPAGIVLLG